MNYAPILNKAFSLAQMLSFTTGNPVIIGGTAIITTFAEIMEDAFGGTGDSGLSTALQNMGTQINAHMDELFAELLAANQNQKLSDDMNVITSMASEMQRDQQNISNALNAQGQTDAQILAAFAAEVATLQAKVDNTLSGGSALSLMVADCLANGTAAQAYATLPLTMAATLFYSNYLKYASTVQLQLAAKQALAKGALPTGGLRVDVVNSLNTSRYMILQQAVSATLPLVQQLNNAVVQRENDADAVQITEVASCAPVGSGDPAFPGTDAIGSVHGGYGRLSDNNRAILNMLVKSQGWRTSWLNSTAVQRLWLLSKNDILLLNYNLTVMNQAAVLCYATLPVNPVDPIAKPLPQLSGIYPPPPDFQPPEPSLRATPSACHVTFAKSIPPVQTKPHPPDPKTIPPAAAAARSAS